MTNFLTRFHTYLHSAALSQSFSTFYCVRYKHLMSLNVNFHSKHLKPCYCEEDDVIVVGLNNFVIL